MLVEMKSGEEREIFERGQILQLEEGFLKPSFASAPLS